MTFSSIAWGTVASLLCSVVAAEESASAKVSAARREGNFLVHDVESNYQQGKTQIRVLLPEDRVAGKRYPVVFVLPVEAGTETRYGDGLAAVFKDNLHNKYGAVFVAPTFSHLPWYADHPDDLSIRQETYFTEVVVPFVDKEYPTQAAATGRLLLGFSKSGWGAWSLLLRHPKAFGRAAAWDAPLMMERVGPYGTTAIFGSQGNFEQYRLTDLLRKQGAALGDEPRLILTGYGNFRTHHQEAKTVLDKATIPHVYRDGPERKHDWHSGWVPEAVSLLLERADMLK